MGKGKKYLNSKRKDRNAGFNKRGSAAKGTDSAHRLSHQVMDGFLPTLPGRGGHGTTEKTDAKAISKALNRDENLRIKSQHGNRILDVQRDKKLIEAHTTGASLTEKTTAQRAVQAYKGGKGAADKSGNRPVAQVTQALGKLTFNDGKPGRPPTIKSMAKGQQIKSDKGKSLFERARDWFS